MYELIQVAENSFYMDCPVKVGFFKTGKDEVVIIDSGSDKDAGKKVKRILDSQGWKLNAIYNTHSHADHTGGNYYLQSQTGCRIFANDIESAVTEFPVLEPAMLYGGFPMDGLRNKFLMAHESVCEKISPDALPEGLEIIPLPGHTFSMVGFRTSDNVVFLADCLSGADTLEKYHITYLYDVQAYLDTLDMVRQMQADCFVPSHAPQTSDIAPLAEYNIKKTLETAEQIKAYLTEPLTLDELLARVFDGYGMSMNLQQRMLIGSTVKSYLSYLKGLNQADYSFTDNRMLWFSL